MLMPARIADPLTASRYRHHLVIVMVPLEDLPTGLDPPDHRSVLGVEAPLFEVVDDRPFKVP